MISRIIEWCAHNRFLVFTLAGIWSMGHIPLDALPDISDVQVIIHTNWEGEPPNIIEDQVTYPIVTALLAAPRVKAVRAQTMFNDSYVFVVFEDGTDIYWARSRVVEYLQTIAGRLPANVHPAIGPDATGAGWVYEYVLVDHSHKQSLADLRSIQDWHLRYQLATVPGVAEVASIGGFVRQYQVQLDPNKLLAYGIPLSTIIERVKSSTNEVGGRVLELSGTRYMIRGLGYLKSLDDLANVPVMAKNGTPVLIKDLGTVSFGPDLREGVAEWNGEGETVGGIVVMRYGLNALNVISGVKKKLAEIKGSLPPGVEVVSGYDRGGLISESINTLKHSLLEEAIIVSLVIIVFLFHFRSALIPILTLPIALAISFIPMYYLNVSSNIMSLGGLALAIGVLVDAAIVMVENGYRHLSERPASSGEGLEETNSSNGPALYKEADASAGKSAKKAGERERVTRAGAHSHRFRQAGGPRAVLFSPYYCGLVPPGVPAGSTGRTHVPPAGMDEDSGCGLLVLAGHHSGSHPHGHFYSRKAAARIGKSDFKNYTGTLFAGLTTLPEIPQDDSVAQFGIPGGDVSLDVQNRQSVHAAFV